MRQGNSSKKKIEIPVLGNYMSKQNGSYHVPDSDPANRMTVGSTGTASEKTLIEENILDEILNQKLCNSLKYLIFDYIGIPDLIKMNLLKRKSYIKEQTLEVSRKDSYIRIWDNLVNELNKWEKDIWDKYPYRGRRRHTDDLYMSDLLEDDIKYYSQSIYEERLSWLEDITKNKYSNRHWYENHVSRGDYKFITSRNLIELLKLAKRCSNIEDHYELSCIGYYRAENFHIRLGEIHEEMIDYREWRIMMNKLIKLQNWWKEYFYSPDGPGGIAVVRNLNEISKKQK